MNKGHTPFSRSLYKNRYGLLVFFCLSLVTAIVLATTPSSIATPQKSTGQLSITTKLSQTKLVKGDLNTVYLDVNIKPPKIDAKQSEQRASDLIVVLDRSGSMAEANKMNFAKEAIHDLLSRLNDSDRFALVSFSDGAIVHSPLVAINADTRAQLNTMVNGIQPEGGTNIGEGLNSAISLLTDKRLASASKVLLLSDGHANQGVTDLTGLSQIVVHITRQESVLSSIGIGLDFNETLMSSLADYGMGNYAYLENLSGLGEIFARNLNATRAIYAANSTMTITVADGVELVDAAGYPINKEAANTYSISTGQLLGNSDKKFVMTFNVKAKTTGDISLGKMLLSYQVHGENLQQAIAQQQLLLAMVEPERRQESVASINKDVYQQSWVKNNLGLMQKKLSQWVREGNKDKADQVINEYRQEVAKAEKQAAMPMASPELDEKISALKSSVADAFSGDQVDQELKRKRAAKSLQIGSIKEQRSEAQK